MGITKHNSKITQKGEKRKMKEIKGIVNLNKNNELERQNKLLRATLRFYESILQFKSCFDDDDSAEYEIDFDIKF